MAKECVNKNNCKNESCTGIDFSCDNYETEPGRQIMNLSCKNNKCANYFEDLCLYGGILFLDEDGKCECFKEGKNDAYNYISKEGDYE